MGGEKRAGERKNHFKKIGLYFFLERSFGEGTDGCCVAFGGGYAEDSS